jgi:translation initiation factor eIF-2B subunit beta
MAIAEASPSEPTASTSGSMQQQTAALSSSHHQSQMQLRDAASVREWLQANHKRQLVVLDQFASELRRSLWVHPWANAGGDSYSCSSGSGSSSSSARGGAYGDSSAATPSDSSAVSTTTTASISTTNDQWVLALKTVDVLRHLVGSTRWKSPAQLLVLLRGVGNELHSATSSHSSGLVVVVVGNMVRRVMAATREEAMRDSASASNAAPVATAASAADGRLSLQSMLWALPQHVKTRPSSYRAQHRHHHDSHQRQESFGSVADLQPQDGANVSSEAGGGGTAAPAYPPGYYSTRPDLKHSIMEAIQEMVGELEDLYRNVNEQAATHVHAGEIILTIGRSNTVLEFLKAAFVKNRNFTVLVCEGGGGGGSAGREQASLLAKAGIDATLIPYSSLFAVMSRVNKVILPAHAVLANGGLVSIAGCNAMALAANHHSVPVVCVSGLFKLTPLFPHDGQDTLNDLVSPPLGGMAGGPSTSADGVDLRDPDLRDVEYVCPVHDYVKPEHIRLYVTNVGSFQPNYTYRLLAEYYHVDDWESFG